MRATFATGLSVLLLPSLLFGSVYAWSAGGSVSGNDASIGEAALALLYFPNGAAVLGPNDGTPVQVGVGVVDVLDDFALLLSGEVSIDAVTDQPPGDASCSPSDFVGSVGGLAVSMTPAEAATAFNTVVAMKTTASAACQGDEVSYTIEITGTTF